MEVCVPKERLNRYLLQKACMDRGLLQSTMREIIKPMVGKTDEEKECIAVDLLSRVKAGEFDTTERTKYERDED